MSDARQPYESLLAWQKADEFVIAVYAATKSYPKEELYGVTSQLRRAALSVVLNIVEGRARGTTKEYLRFLFIARGSSTECAYLLDISRRLAYLTDDQYQSLEKLRSEASFLLQRLVESLKT